MCVYIRGENNELKSVTANIYQQRDHFLDLVFLKNQSQKFPGDSMALLLWAPLVPLNQKFSFNKESLIILLGLLNNSRTYHIYQKKKV